MSSRPVSHLKKSDRASRCLHVMAAAFLSCCFNSNGALCSPRDVLVWITVVDHATNAQKDAGTGTLLNGEGFILTARHILSSYNPVTDDLKVSIASKNRPPVPASKFNCAGEKVDVCLIRINLNDVPAGLDHFKFSCANPHIDDIVTAWGFPSDVMDPSLHRQGTISGELGAAFMVPTQIGLVQGMSGGPVLDKEGKIIGVSFGVAQQNGIDVHDFAFFTPVRFARSLLNDVGVDCPSGDTFENPNISKLTDATITTTTWPTGGWNAILTNPIKSSAVISYASLEAKNPTPGQYDLGFPLTFNYGLKSLYRPGEGPYLTELQGEHASNIHLDLFGSSPQACVNWHLLREKLFDPTSDFGKWQCRLRLDLQAISGEHATIHSDPFQCNRIPVPPPAC